MSSRLLEVEFRRVLLCTILLVALFALAVSAGTLTHDPANNEFASADEWGHAPETYVGERVYANGIVVSTDPLTVSVEHDSGERELVVRNHGSDARVDQEFGVFGTLLDTETIDAERTHHRDRWESRYMYAISAVGVLWVFARLARTWAIDRRRWGFVPRGDDRDA